MKLRLIVLLLLLTSAMAGCATAQDFSAGGIRRYSMTATGTPPRVTNGTLVDVIGYASPTDGLRGLLRYDSGSALTVDNVFVFAPAAGQPGRLVAVDRSFLDLEFAGLSNNADITTLLDTAADNMTGSVFRMRLPRALTNLTCSTVTFPSNLKRFEVYAGNCTITQDDAEETMWILTNPQNVFIERGVRFVGNLDEETFTASTEGLIKINGAAKSGTGGVIECHADFSDTTSTGLAIVGVALEANAYQMIKVSGEYIDSGIDASSYAVERTVTANIRDLDGYNVGQPGSRRYTDQPPVIAAGADALQARPNLSQGNYPRLVNVRTFHGHDEFEDQVGTSGNQNAYVDLPAGSVWQLDSPVRIPSGCTITTDEDNPATIIHPPSGQACIVLQGADIVIENVICDFKQGETWQEFQTFLALTGGAFFTGDGASWKFAFDNEASGSTAGFFQHETLTFGNGATGKLGSFGATFAYDTEASGPFVVGEELRFGNGSTGQVSALTDNGASGTFTIIYFFGTLANNDTIEGIRSGATALVNGSATAKTMEVTPLSGSAPIDNTTITGGTSARTAMVAGSVTTIGSLPDQQMRNIDLRNLTFINSDDTRRNLNVAQDRTFAYDAESGGPFQEGEVLNFSGGAVATLFSLTDNGSTGTMKCVLTSGTIANDNTITGATSGATAAVNGTVTSTGHSGDSWCISFVHNSGSSYAGPVRNVKVRNCRMLSRDMQLTANGSGTGYDGVEITGNYVKYGHANPIAMSTLSDFGDFKNILIADNEIDSQRSAAIYVGLDPDGTGGAIDVVSLEDVIIRNNRITSGPDSVASGANFPVGIIIRCTGNCRRLQIRDNVFNNTIGTGTYTFIDLRGNPVGPDNTYLIEGNQYIGNGDFEIGAEYVRYYDDLPLMDNLVSFWPMDEASGNILDAVGGNDLQDTNSVTAVADGPNGVGARRFTQANSERGLSADSPWNRVPKTSFSGSIWVRVNSDASGGLVAKYGLGGAYLVSYSSTTDLISFSVRDSGNTNTVTSAVDVWDGTPQWNHVAWWYDFESSTIGISVDNETAVEAGATAGIGNPPWLFNVGYNGTSAFIDADMAQLGFWRGRILSATDRTNLYNAGNGLPFDTDDFELVIE